MTTRDIITVMSIVLTALGGAGGIASLILVRRQSGKLRADASQVLTSAAVSLVAPLEGRLRSAEERAAEAERRAQSADAALQRVEIEALRLRYVLQRWYTAIMNPTAVIEQVREMVNTDRHHIT